MLLLRPLARRFTSFSIGANSQFFFWQDPWLNHTPIVQTYNSQLISIFESTSHARIEEFLDHRNWNLPLTNHLWAVELRSQITHVNISNVDEISWQGLTFKDVCISSIWHSLRPPEPSPPGLMLCGTLFTSQNAPFSCGLLLKIVSLLRKEWHLLICRLTYAAVFVQILLRMCPIFLEVVIMRAIFYLTLFLLLLEIGRVIKWAFSLSVVDWISLGSTWPTCFLLLVCTISGGKEMIEYTLLDMPFLPIILNYLLKGRWEKSSPRVEFLIELLRWTSL